MAPQIHPETLGERVKRLRTAILIEFNDEEKPMTQEQLAERCGCDLCTIWRIENDRQVPLVTLAKRLAKALNVTLDELMDGIV